MDEVRFRLAANIKKFRNEKGLSVDDVGRYVGKKGKTISAWENGRGQPDADEMILLCRLFDIDIDEFFGVPTDDITTSEGVSIVKESDLSELYDCYLMMTDDAKTALLRIARDLAETFTNE